MVFLVALLYSNLGQGGAAGYLAIMAVFGYTPYVMKPSALALNILVALVISIRSFRAGFFHWRTFWPFAAGSIPATLLAGRYVESNFFYKSVLALVLLSGAAQLFFSIGTGNEKKSTVPPVWMALPAGVAIGLVCGLVGLGGGILLAPLLLLKRWARTEDVAGVVAPFVLLNSIAGFLLTDMTMPFEIGDMVYWAPAVLIGAWIGSEIDSRTLPLGHFRKALSIVFVVASLRLISTIL